MPDFSRLDAVKRQRPLIHCVSNLVSANDCANLALAIGASPMMAQALPEMEAITAASIMNQMNNLVFIWISGLSAAVGILTGILVGAGETEKIRPYARLVQLTFLAVGVCSCGVILLLKGPFLSLYNITPASQTIADQMMTLLSVTFIGTC